MRISEIYNLNKSQAELDFVDIDIERDTPLFLDPFFLSIRTDRWSLETTMTLRTFFQQVIDLIRANNRNECRALFRNLHEPNSTCLGMSRGNPAGRGVGRRNTDDLFDSIINSRAIETGLIQDIEDNAIFIDGFGKDKLSDMTTNIIRRHLIEYTIDQCNLNGIPLDNSVPSGFYWHRGNLQWQSEFTQGLRVNGRTILLVPKGVVSYSDKYTPKKYYQRFVTEFLQHENLELNSALVNIRRNGERYVNKKDVRERNPYSRELIRNITIEHPELLQRLKKETSIDSLSNHALSDIDMRDIVNGLIIRLQEIQSGNQQATLYHRTMIGILELIFYPHLIYPFREAEINEGRKRIDITFDNAAKDGIFFRFANNMGLSSQYILVECKNYSEDPANPELDQLSGRFSPNRGRVGILVCRTIDNIDLMIQRCRDTYREERGLVIPLCDDDIIRLLQSYNNETFKDDFLSERVRQIALR